jgi:glycosyltransferase involved in cell wall biosynthesis
VRTEAEPLVIATILRERGNTGVQTHVRQLREYLAAHDLEAGLVTPFARPRALTVPVFAVRLPLERVSRPASVVWYRHWHEAFLRTALRRYLSDRGEAVIYAQEPLAAHAALAARRGPEQRVVMAVHFRVSQADEWAGKGAIRPDGRAYRAIRQFERDVIPRVDGLVYVSRWARTALTDWLPEAADVPSDIIGNFVAPPGEGQGPGARELIGDLVTTGHLEPVKNHRFLLEVLAQFRRAGQVLTLDVFGDGPLLPQLQRQARSLGLESQVRFRGFRRDIRDFLPGYRAYVHASYSESSSLAIMEAMAAGLPIIAADIGPIAELCDDGVEARFWSLDDPAKAAATLTALLGSERERSATARAASDRFRHDYDADVVAPRLVSFLRGKVSPASGA